MYRPRASPSNSGSSDSGRGQRKLPGPGGMVAMWALLMAALSPSVHGQSSAALIDGIVIDGKTAVAVPEAVVQLIPIATPGGRPGQTPQAIDAGITDTKGRFYLILPAAGTFQIRVSKPGYMDGGFDKQRPSQEPSPFVAKPGINAVQLKLWRYAVVRGAVTTASGEPAVGYRVAVIKKVILSGRPLFWNPSFATTFSTTDDRGVFRASQLDAGEYTACVSNVSSALPSDLFASFKTGQLVLDSSLRTQLGRFGSDVAQPGSTTTKTVEDYVWLNPGTPYVFEPTCSPETHGIGEATTTKVDAGDVSAPMNIKLSPVENVKVCGQLLLPDRQPASNVALRLLSPFVRNLFRDAGFETAVTLTKPGGTFCFWGVPPGSYIVTADVESGTAATLWMSEAIQVGRRDLLGAEYSLRELPSVAGRVVVNNAIGATSVPGAQQFTMMLDPVDGRSFRTRVATAGKDGAFVLAGVPPGRYFLRSMTAPAGWFLQDAQLEGRDGSDEPFEVTSSNPTPAIVTFTNKPSELSVTVLSKSGQPFSNAEILIAPTESSHWIDYGWRPNRISDVRSSSDGSGKILGLPTGSYFVMAMSPDFASTMDGLPASLRALSTRGQRITVTAGERQQLQLRVIGEAAR